MTELSSIAVPAREAEEVATPGVLGMMREDMRCIFRRDPAARSIWEVLTTYPGLHAVMAHRIAHVLWRSGWRYLARLLAYLARALTNVDIHPGARIGRRFFIDHGAGVVIGETAEVGDDVTLYHGVTLGGTTWNRGKRHPTLGDGVVVGAGAKILGAILIGSAARIGANSVVVKDVPSGRTVVGIPGRLVGERAVPLRSLDPLAAIDLDHHLIPDPVGKAIGCLLERIDALEQDLRQLRGAAAPSTSAESCGACAAGELCCEEHRHE